MQQILDTIIPIIILLLELIAVIVIVIGMVKSIYIYVKFQFNDDDHLTVREMASSLSLALEYILGAEILETLIIQDVSQLLTMSVLLILRIIITFVLHWELEQTK